MRKLTYLLASLLLLGSSSGARADVVSFDFAGSLKQGDYFRGSSTLAGAISGHLMSGGSVPFTGSFSYDASPYTFTGPNGSNSLVEGSLSFTILGKTFQSIPGLPVLLFTTDVYNGNGPYDFSSSFEIRGSQSGLPLVPADFGATPVRGRLELTLSIDRATVDFWDPPTQLPHGLNPQGTSYLYLSLEPASSSEPPYLRGEFNLDSIAPSGTVQQAPEPSGLLLGTIGTVLAALFRRRRVTRR
jgi:hypothetical protein